MKKLIVSLPLFILMNSMVYAQQNENINLKKGEKFLVENKIVVTSKQEMMGQTMESNADMNTAFNIEVKNVKDSGYNLLNIFTKMNANITAMSQNMSFNSDKKEDMNGEYAGNLKSIINTPQDVMMDRSGKIDTRKKTGNSTETKPDVMMLMMQQFVGDPAESGYGAALAFMYIPKKSGVGYSWTDTSSQGGIKKSITYNITQIKGNVATINISGKLDTDLKSEIQGMEVSTKSSGILKGNQLMDISTGVIKEKNTTLESSGTIQIMGQEMPMTTKVTLQTNVKSLP